jgi:ABC-type phosphate transport system auxiliary subunit
MSLEDRPNSEDFDNSCWCPKCAEYFEHCLHQISIRGRLEILGGLYSKKIVYRCVSNGHVFSISSLRKHKHQTQYKIEDNSCPDCKKEERELQKKHEKEEEERIRSIMAEKQRELFERSRK